MSQRTRRARRIRSHKARKPRFPLVHARRLPRSAGWDDGVAQGKVVKLRGEERSCLRVGVTRAAKRSAKVSGSRATWVDASRRAISGTCTRPGFAKPSLCAKRHLQPRHCSRRLSETARDIPIASTLARTNARRARMARFSGVHAYGIRCSWTVVRRFHRRSSTRPLCVGLLRCRHLVPTV